MGLLHWLFGTSGFMAHGYCFMWKPALVRLHFYSDLGTGLSYIAISLILVHLVRRARHDIPFHWVFLAFGTFIIACGCTHLIEDVTLFTPVYWFSGVVKAVTAVASIATAFAMPPLVPRTLEMLRQSKLAEAHRQELGRVNEVLRGEVAERVRAEEETRRLNQELERRVRERTAQLELANMQLAEKAAIVQHSRDAIFGMTLEGVVTSWNAAAEKLYGYSAREMLGRDAALLLAADRQEEVEDVRRRLSSGQEIPPYETVRLRKDGTPVQVSIMVSPIVGEDTAVRGASVSARDISEQKKAEWQLREVQKLESLGVIAGGVAHDFNNLLLGIMGNASLALEDLPPSGAAYAGIQQVISASERAAQLTQQLLAYAGKGRLVMQALDLSKLVRDISSLVTTSIPKHVQLHLHLADSLPTVKADPGQLQQVVMNLVINAAEAIPEDRAGAVHITTMVEELDEHSIRHSYTGEALRPGAYVVLDVRDNGSGMDAAIQARIFDPFFTTKFTGRGLGLSAVIGVVRSHKGAIRVYSEPGRGTTMKVLLPVSAAAAARGAAPAQPGGDLRGSGLVLVVDDEEIVRQTAKAALEHFGYTVLLAENGREGVETFRSHASAIAVVLLDITMPVMGGEEAARRIRAIRPDARIIFSSGYNDEEAVQRMTAGRSSEFVQKPYIASTLAGLLKRIIGGGAPPAGA